MILIIIAITLLANLADYLLKRGAIDAGTSLADPLSIFLTPWIWMGALLGIIAMATWVYVLGRHQISHAYPVFVGLGFVNITIISWLFLKEDIGPQRLVGTLLILAGIVIVHLQSRSETLKPKQYTDTDTDGGD
ncbi:MAG: SMR family transporter [Thermoleophilia bacterium]|jgi:multidrug transporter EmrE-like cation transporter